MSLERINIADMVPHPNNPRVAFREDVVEAIAAQLMESKVFADWHALTVRLMDGKYQILSGHQRHEAARRAKIEEIPCWVVEMSDEEAMMLLVLSNAQGELDSLEIGLHA